MAKLTFQNLTKIYQPHQVMAVKDFNLEIQDKEFVVLVGPSGCGKSTTIRMIAGLEEITSGELYIDDILVNHVAPKDRDIAMVFQNYALYPHMTVYENMAIGLTLRKVPKLEIDKRVREAAQTLGIEDLLDRRPKALSGGQKQRVALGRAMVREPKVFLMDEPLSNLDAKLRVQTRSEIVKLHKRLQTTVVYVTHDQTEAMTMGDRIVVMKDGMIQQIATPLEIYERPQNVFVAGFIGNPPMNFIKVKIDDVNPCLGYLGHYKIHITPEQSKLLEHQGYLGKTVILGIRPEDIYLSVDVSEATRFSQFQAQVDLVEMVGAETLVHLTAEENHIIVRVNTRNSDLLGHKNEFFIDHSKILFFDPTTENTIC